MPNTRFRGGNKPNFRGRGRGRGYGRGRGRGGSSGGTNVGGEKVQLETQDGTNTSERLEDALARDALDEELGYKKWEGGAETERVGWLVDMQPSMIKTEGETASGRAAVDYYFLTDSGSSFKVTVPYEAYFYVVAKRGYEAAVEEYLLKRYEDHIVRITRERKLDLDIPNHLLSAPPTLLKLHFSTIRSLLAVRRELLPLAATNLSKVDAVDAYAEMLGGGGSSGVDVAMEIEVELEDGVVTGRTGERNLDPQECIMELREYDVPYYLRVAIDLNMRVGLWYTITILSTNPTPTFKLIKERVDRADPVVLAYDIETTKAPLKFPDVNVDRIMMISYMVDGQGYLVTNREIVSEDIADFEYTPKPEYEGLFQVFNEPDEEQVIKRFFSEVRNHRPSVMVTYNGDFFDFPFVCDRAKILGIDMLKEIGMMKDNEGEFKGRGRIHMDCFRWVKRDSYLPQGSQGLKAVTVAKLGYNPIELDPELMTPYALEQPQILARYSVSDAVATYYLYMKYVHPFIFSLCNIIPLNPDEVLRKGSGTLCETLLMVEAYRAEIIMPNRHQEATANMFEGHLLESETYVGGHVEALEAGVFRSDIPADFRIVPAACQELIDEVDEALRFAIVEESKVELSSVLNYDDVRSRIISALEELRDHPLCSHQPLIYHLDVAAMYPNIMLSNRLQPDAIVSEATCAACDYNRPGKKCDRRMEWAWRGEFFPAKLDEFKMVRNALEQEMFPPKYPGRPQRRFNELSPSEQTTLLHKRLGDYSTKVYKKRHDNKVEVREAIICQREHSFYTDTVRNFRDRRYVYKGEHKKWKKNLDAAVEKGAGIDEVLEAKKMIVLFDSLQLAHKCILNSFYGYVMRKGARWHSMEMAGITCLTGARIIQMARTLVEQIGRPLELDTDGIWCMLPGTFPDKFSFELSSGKKLGISYPCTMLNHRVHKSFTNHQYHDLKDPARGIYSVRSENSIFFELDGPYRAMILPSSKEEDKLLKKRYAVFEEDGSLAELKGFEVKRRGELQLIKIFQTQIFEKFLLGDTLKECYSAVAVVANQWLNVLTSKASTLEDEELVELIAENRSMSKTLAEYAGQKSTSISTAKRLAEFLGDQMVKDKGLACKFIISAKPLGAPVAERAVPVAIFSAESSVKKHFLRKWLKDNGLVNFDIRAILDWDYYIERLSSVIQKLITIPAAMQKVPNPVPRVPHPDWLMKRVTNQGDRFKQQRLGDMFAKQQLVANEPGFVARPLIPRAQKPVMQSAVEINTEESTQRAKAKLWTNYRKAVELLKPVWRKELEGKKQTNPRIRRAGQIGSLFHEQSASMASKTWEIIQMTPSDRTPGEYKMWLLINDTLQCLRLRIPREFYVNFRQLPVHSVWPDSCVHESLVRTLPRSQKAIDFVKVSLPEQVFVKQEADFFELLNNPDVDGVYELQVPLIVRALLRLGTRCEVASGSSTLLSKGLSHGFDLYELDKATSSSRRKYLQEGRAVRYAWLYHVSNNKDLHIFSLIVPQGSYSRVFIVDPRKQKSVPNLTKYYAERLAALGEESNTGAFDYPDDLNIIVDVYATESDALKALVKDIQRLPSLKSGPNVFVIHSSKQQSYYEDFIPNFPIIMHHANKSDNAFGLQWQADLTRRMIDHYLHVSKWLKDYIQIAERFEVPVGNIEQDWALFLADIEFARRLSKADMILWWSSSSRPDLGGREADSNSQQSHEELLPPEVSYPGCYSNATVEVDLRDLALDALLQSSLVYELDGTEGSAIGFDTASHNLDQYAKGSTSASIELGDASVSAQTLSLLKSLVREWWNDGCKPEGWQSRHLCSNLLRWLSSSSSQMFDPAIHRFLHGLMRKTFSRLLAEFKRLGSHPVYADFSRIWLATNKPTVESAYAYGTYIVTAVNDREIFKYLNMSVLRFWDQLVWLDNANFAGVISDLEEKEAGGESQEGGYESVTRVDARWNIATFLPPAVQSSFLKVVSDFVHGLYQIKCDSADNERTPLKVMLQNASQTHPNQEKKAAVDKMREFIAGRLTRHMLERVNALDKAYADSAVDPELRESFEFPILPGSYLKLKKPVLEFIKFVCAVFSLAKDVNQEVLVLKKNCLELIGVKEFASEAHFRNPCLGIKGTIVICNHCNEGRVLDLCRDPELVLNGNRPGNTGWNCLRCAHPYDRTLVETNLITSLLTQLAAYQQSDLRCTRCNQMKVGSLEQNCHCSGPFAIDSGVGVKKGEGGKLAVISRLKVLKGVAQWYRMSLLEDVVDDVEEGITKEVSSS